MLNICLVGQPYWVGRLMVSLREHCAAEVEVCPLLPQASGIGHSLRQAARADIFMRIGFRPGAPTPRGRLLDACWTAMRAINRRACAVYYWIGSDVHQTVLDAGSGALRLSPFSRAKRDAHLAEVGWLANELESIGLQAQVIRFPAPVLRADHALPLPRQFTVLTHIPDFRHRFYGGDSIYEAARELTQVQFEVVAGHGAWIPKPLPNLRFHGWQADMGDWYRRASVVVRMVQHDGLGLTIQEALSFGRYAVYSYPVPYTHHVGFQDMHGLQACLGELWRLHQNNMLPPNNAGWEYAIHEFNEMNESKALIHYLSELVSRSLKD